MANLQKKKKVSAENSKELYRLTADLAYLSTQWEGMHNNKEFMRKQLQDAVKDYKKTMNESLRLEDTFNMLEERLEMQATKGGEQAALSVALQRQATKKAEGDGIMDV